MRKAAYFTFLLMIFIFVSPNKFFIYAEDGNEEGKENSSEENGDKLKRKNAAGSVTARIQPYMVGMGYTIVKGSSKSDFTNYRLGLQTNKELVSFGTPSIEADGSLTSLPHSLSIGLDLGYIRAYAHRDSLNVDRELSFRYFNINPFFQFKFLRWFIVQAGGGFYSAAGDNKDSGYGLMFAGGFEIYVSKTISIPFILRSDLILTEEKSALISLAIGIGIDL